MAVVPQLMASRSIELMIEPDRTGEIRSRVPHVCNKYKLRLHYITLYHEDATMYKLRL